jgi:hypothetical protein
MKTIVRMKHYILSFHMPLDMYSYMFFHMHYTFLVYACQ